MNNLIEKFLHIVKTIADDEPKQPLHTGEVTSCWMYTTALNEALTYEEIGLSTTTDRELADLLKQGIELCGGQVDKLKLFMKNEGIPLPPAPEAKPKCESEDIPLGVKFTDEEIANGLSLKVAVALVACANEVATSVRNDYSAMFMGFLIEQLTFGTQLKSVLKKRGWLKTPPYFTPAGTPHRGDKV